MGYDANHQFAWLLIMTAHTELGNPVEALEAADRFDELRQKVNFGNEAAVSLVRAVCYHHSGEEALARSWFARGDEALDLLRYEHPEDWERAPLVRRRNEAAALLGL